MCVFVTSSGGVPVHASACGHACGDTALLHMHSPEPQGALRQRWEAWLQAGGAEGQQGAGCWGEMVSCRDYRYPTSTAQRWY